MELVSGELDGLRKGWRISESKRIDEYVFLSNKKRLKGHNLKPVHNHLFLSANTQNERKNQKFSKANKNPTLFIYLYQKFIYSGALFQSHSFVCPLYFSVFSTFLESQWWSCILSPIRYFLVEFCRMGEIQHFKREVNGTYPKFYWVIIYSTWFQIERHFTKQQTKESFHSHIYTNSILTIGLLSFKVR